MTESHGLHHEHPHLVVIDDPDPTSDVVRGCPGGPGHPARSTSELTVNAAKDVVRALDNGDFDSMLRPTLLVVCQCNLADMIGVLARMVLDARGASGATLES